MQGKSPPLFAARAKNRPMPDCCHPDCRSRGQMITTGIDPPTRGEFRVNWKTRPNVRNEPSPIVRSRCVFRKLGADSDASRPDLFFLYSITSPASTALPITSGSWQRMDALRIWPGLLLAATPFFLSQMLRPRRYDDRADWPAHAFDVSHAAGGDGIAADPVQFVGTLPEV